MWCVDVPATPAPQSGPSYRTDWCSETAAGGHTMSEPISYDLCPVDVNRLRCRGLAGQAINGSIASLRLCWLHPCPMHGSVDVHTPGVPAADTRLGLESSGSHQPQRRCCCRTVSQTQDTRSRAIVWQSTDSNGPTHSNNPHRLEGPPPTQTRQPVSRVYSYLGTNHIEAMIDMRVDTRGPAGGMSDPGIIEQCHCSFLGQLER